jgi:ribosomal protein L11 methyltransferase
MNYIQISVEASAEQQELLIAELSDFGALGFEEKVSHLIAYFEEEGFLSYEVNMLIRDFPHTMNSIPQQNWNSVWESNFDPVIVDSFCGIRAGFHQPIPEVAHEIIITPKMSFGTGHHATTYMMIHQMQRLNFKGKTVFDFGTGTGILAILAKRLGAESVSAIDVDDWSIENAQENFALNCVEGIDLCLSSAIPAREFDIVLANINRNVLLQYATHLAGAVVDGGRLLLSGILAADETDITNCFQPFAFQLEHQLERNKWLSMLFSKKG